MCSTCQNVTSNTTMETILPMHLTLSLRLYNLFLFHATFIACYHHLTLSVATVVVNNM